MNRFVRVALGSDVVFAQEDGAVLDSAPWSGGKPTGKTVTIGETRLAPVAPGKIIGIGTNYRAHAKEMGKPLPQEPLLFMKPPTALIGTGEHIVRPPGYERTDFEGELGVVIGKAARHVSEADALAHVFGYCVVNDVTVRDLQARDGQFTRAKGFDTFCPTGPAVVTGIADPNALRLTTHVNGKLAQDSSTSDMVFGVAALVSFISRVMTLVPGDLIATGTPSGVGPIAPGDEVVIEIEHIGILRNRVVGEDRP